MRIEDVTLEVRDLNLQRVGQIDADLWTDVKIVPDHLGRGAWSLSLPAEDPMAAALAQPGAGLIVTGPSGVLMSGPTCPFKRLQTTRDPQGIVTVEGESDTALLWDYLAWPDPAHAVDAQGLAHDVRSAPVETLLHQLVDVNLGPGARSARRGLLAQKLVLGSNLARGGVRESRARFPILGEHMVTLAQLGGLGFRIVQVDDDLVFQTYEPVDRSLTIRLDLENATLSRIEYEVAPPVVTRPIVAGQGEGDQRTIIQRTSVEATAAEAAWGRVKETWRDRRDTDELVELEQAGDELLVEGGVTKVVSKVIPSDAVDVEYGIDWREGDRITVVVGNLEQPAVVSRALLSLSRGGVMVGAQIGEEV